MAAKIVSLPSAVVDVAVASVRGGARTAGEIDEPEIAGKDEAGGSGDSAQAGLARFRAKLLSSGVVEGLNNKAKVTMRRSYGVRAFRTLELALYHSLGKLPEPESTHDFF